MDFNMARLLLLLLPFALAIPTRCSPVVRKRDISSVSIREWQQLNASVSGRLHQAMPIGAPCFKTLNGSINALFNAATCAVVLPEATDTQFLESQFGSYMNVGVTTMRISKAHSSDRGTVQLATVPVNRRRLRCYFIYE